MSLHSLGKRLQNNFPTASIEIDEPADSHGGSFLDVRLDDHTVIIEWRKRRGFGISARPDIEYGAGVDETYDSEDEAFKRVVTLLVSKTQTIPQVKLRELREARGLSQMELADRMDVQQASISSRRSVPAANWRLWLNSPTGPSDDSMCRATPRASNARSRFTTIAFNL